MIGNIFRKKLRESKITNAEVAQILNITPQALSQKLHGKRPFTIEEFFIMCRIIRENPVQIAKKCGLY